MPSAKHPKAGRPLANKQARAAIDFNSQPREGGWENVDKSRPLPDVEVPGIKNEEVKIPTGTVAQTSPYTNEQGEAVSTHSRPKAAGYFMIFSFKKKYVSTHSRPKAAGAV